MNVTDYCRNMDTELTAWKAKLYNIIRQVEKLDTGNKQRMFEKINGLNIIMTELDDRLEKLRTSCPTEWSAENQEIKGKISDLGHRYDEAALELFDYDIGG